MRRLRSPGLSMVGAIFGLLPITPGAILCLPLSIWAILVLNRRDVRNAFIVRTRQRIRAADRVMKRRFSRKAIVAACLMPLFFIFVVFFLQTSGPQSSNLAGETAPLFAIGLIGLPGLLAPFITTILGFVAVSDIRRSNGRLVGLGLAFADAAFFPFLLLDALIFGACWFGIQDAGAPTETAAMLLLVMVTLLVVTNGLAGWWLWRKVSAE
ncbi:MAG TPA: hypothetical protein EYG03_09465 [Planctomycetes bacterium]|nr:hypothetical protein [Fuerstiella sp.]HIK92192.1 hypothetical protein [Planctomycetota bacterium]